MSTVASRPPEVAERHHKPWWHRALRIAALLAVAVIAVFVLKDKLPSPQQVWSALTKANWWWVATACLLQIASIGMLIRQQRRLLKVFGVSVKLSRVSLITYSSTALSMSLPAGSAVGAGYSYRQYRANGASPATAATVLLISGILSVVGLVMLFLAGLGLAASSKLLGLGHGKPILTVALAALLIAILIALATLLARRTVPAPPDVPPATPRLDAYSAQHPRLGKAFRQALHTLRQAGRVERHDWRLTLWTSAANWALDALCLYASCRAFDIRINLLQLGAIYVGIQLVRQIPLTPGGVGVIEVALLAALVTAHVAQGPASAAVLIYRLFAAWLIVPIGFVMLALLRRHTPVESPPDPGPKLGSGG